MDLHLWLCCKCSLCCAVYLSLLLSLRASVFFLYKSSTSDSCRWGITLEPTQWHWFPAPQHRTWSTPFHLCAVLGSQSSSTWTSGFNKYAVPVVFNLSSANCSYSLCDHLPFTPPCRWATLWRWSSVWTLSSSCCLRGICGSLMAPWDSVRRVTWTSLKVCPFSFTQHWMRMNCVLFKHKSARPHIPKRRLWPYLVDSFMAHRRREEIWSKKAITAIKNALRFYPPPGDAIYGRVMVDPVQNLGDSFFCSIEKVFLCTGADGYVPKYNPTKFEFGCLADSPSLLYRFKILVSLFHFPAWPPHLCWLDLYLTAH